jgi:hypothetical protein
MAETRGLPRESCSRFHVNLAPREGYEKFVKAPIKNVCVHKGLFAPALDRQFPNLRGFVDASDVGQAAKDWPQLNFIIYHGAYRDVGGDPKVAWQEFERTGRISWTSDLADIPEIYGVNNVYADVGQLFAMTLISEPRVTAALMGIMIKKMGVDRVWWGTDAVWTGSPQWQIEGLREPGGDGLREAAFVRSLLTHGGCGRGVRDDIVIIELPAERSMCSDFCISQGQVPICRVVTQAVLTCAGLDFCDALASKTLVSSKRRREPLVASSRQDRGKRHPILDRLIGALPKVRKHRMGCVAQERQSSSGPCRQRFTIVERPPECRLNMPQERADARIPVRKLGAQLVGITRGRPGFLHFLVGRDKPDIVDERAGPHRKREKMLGFAKPHLPAVGWPERHVPMRNKPPISDGSMKHRM